MDRENVIKAYKCCKNSFDRICEKCPYEKDCCHDGIPMFVIKKMVDLLKEQEEREKAICKEICDFIRGACSTDTDDDKDFVCYEIQRIFTRS